MSHDFKSVFVRITLKKPYSEVFDRDPQDGRVRCLSELFNDYNAMVTKAQDFKDMLLKDSGLRIADSDKKEIHEADNVYDVRLKDDRNLSDFMMSTWADDVSMRIEKRELKSPAFLMTGEKIAPRFR